MDFNALTLSHKILSEHIKPGDLCIDATAGRGRDTAFLCGLVGESGKVIAFDIQKEAIESTKELLEAQGLSARAQLRLESHENIALCAKPQTVAGIVFNLGWLPGGNHGIFTKPTSSIAAIREGLALLKPGGIMSICIYYGRDCGFAEKDALLEFLPTVNSAHYTVIVADFVNRPNNPPIPVFIWRES